MKRRLALAIAWLVSLPAGVLTLAALVYVGYSLAADDLYRSWFLASGLQLVGIYAVFVTGLVAAGMAVSGRAAARGARAQRIARGLAWLGVLAAIGLEWQFFEDDDFPLRGLFVAPFVVWGIVAYLLRTREPRAAAPAP